MLTPTASNTIIRPLRTHVNILSQYKMGYIGFIYTNIHLSNRYSHYTMMTITSWPRFRSERPKNYMIIYQFILEWLLGQNTY